MSKTSEQSDDEFHDATDTTNKTDNKADVEEIIRQQTELNLNDDNEPSTNNDSAGAAAATEENKTPEIEDDYVDEEMLKAKEKTMSQEELFASKEKSNEMKLEANELFKQEQAEAAIAIYSEALTICPTVYQKERAILYGNRAAAKIKLGSVKSAIADCTHAINLHPDYVRALIRRAKLFEQDDKLDEALADYKRVCELDPGQPEAREAVFRLPPIINERNEKMKAEMMSKLKDLGNMILKPFGLSTNNFQMQQDPNTGSYSINFQQK